MQLYVLCSTTHEGSTSPWHTCWGGGWALHMVKMTELVEHLFHIFDDVHFGIGVAHFPRVHSSLGLFYYLLEGDSNYFDSS